MKRLARVPVRAAVEAHALRHGLRAGAFELESPRRTAHVLGLLGRYGPLGAVIPIAAYRHPDSLGLVDERGSLTYGELDRRTDAIACAMRDRGVGEGDGVGVLCRNHRGFLDATFAACKVGARVLFLNTDFGGPQLREVCRRERVKLIAHDEEYLELVGETEVGMRMLGWTDAEHAGADTLDGMISEYYGRTPPATDQRPGVVLLTSGTTGTPKGAPRHAGRSLAPLGAMLSKVPFQRGEKTHVAAPMFHALGLAQMTITLGVGSAVVAQRRFSAQTALELVEREQCTALTLVPVMLLRIVSLLEQEPERFDTSSLRIVLVAGSQLEAELARRSLRALGDKIYNFYGSTETAWATIATPEDLRAAPGCCGRPPFGTIVRIYDAAGSPVVRGGEPGRIFVGNGFQFEGYTGGGTKEVIDGLMSTGDVGHFDAGGRLFIDGRDDDMIVSGGKRLAAYVVARTGADALSAEDVKEFVRQNLARFKVPRDVVFLDELPRNPTGKVLKRDLRGSRALSE
jgi:fatty-acyl-CoA synthase